jgi:hypothetical protein
MSSIYSYMYVPDGWRRRPPRWYLPTYTVQTLTSGLARALLVQMMCESGTSLALLTMRCEPWNQIKACAGWPRWPATCRCHKRRILRRRIRRAADKRPLNCRVIPLRWLRLETAPWQCRITGSQSPNIQQKPCESLSSQCANPRRPKTPSTLRKQDGSLFDMQNRPSAPY